MPYLDRYHFAARLIALYPSLADRPASPNLKIVARDDDFREAEKGSRSGNLDCIDGRNFYEDGYEG
jgi:hypothetical protein